jgi:thioredoxin-related protein
MAKAVLLLALWLVALPAPAQLASPQAIELPAWFGESLLDLREDVREAAADGRRVMLYFGQDGCPYCKALMQVNFSQREVVDKMRRHFVAIALNVWGDREVTWIDGATQSEKQLAARLEVQFTPTLVFLDEAGAVALRLNGYYPPRRFEAALDYVAGRMERKLEFRDYLAAAYREEASAKLHDEPFFMKPPLDLRRSPGSRPLAVLFETPYCAGCDELHGEGFARAEVRAELAKLDVARVSLADAQSLTAPDGRRLPAERWARELAIAYTPSIVFFDGSREAFRIEAYVRPFHLASSFAYVSSRAYRREPSFQRFLQARGEAMRRRGESPDLWR